MTKNPLINGLSASAYIAFVAFFMETLSKVIGKTNSPLAGIIIISLFSLSAAVMGCLFGYQPFILYFDGKQKQAIRLLLQTIAVFALTTLLFTLLLVIFK